MLAVLVEKLLIYAEARLDLSEEDIGYYRNVLLFKVGIDKPYKGVLNISEIKAMQTPAALVEEIYAELQKGATSKTQNIDIESTITDILGMLTPIPSVVNRAFRLRHKEGAEKATDYLYNLGVANNYIKLSEVSKNVKWVGAFGENTVNLTINVAKPEKDNKSIAKVLEEDAEEKYPSCALCVENVGFGGNTQIPPRQTLRTVPVKIDDEKWHLQFSPYTYFDRHCIVISDEHKPMTISPRIFAKLLAFTDQFPHFFVGSNSDLPIVGGSILNHEHFQGGAKVMPLFNAKNRKEVRMKDHRRVDVSIVEWPSNVIKLRSYSKRAIVEAASAITEKWYEYENKELDIIPATDETRHATVTPIALKGRSRYEFYLVLRNNRTSKKHPDGIFHAHKAYHHIKKEGIGLIEQAGTFILPARLVEEQALLEQGITAKTPFATLVAAYPALTNYEQFYNELLTSDKTNFEQLYREYVKEVALNILDNTALFKQTEADQKAFIKFIESV